MITIDDAAKVVKDALAGASGFSSTIPGGAWFDRGPDGPDGYPYLVFKIEAGDTEVFSGSAMLQKFTVRVGSYCPIGQAGVSPQNVQKLVNTALVSQDAQTTLQAVSLRNAGEHVLHCRPLNPDAKFDLTLRDGRDVFTSGLRCELLFQGDRSAP